MQTIGQTLTRLRAESGLSQQELARSLASDGISVTNQAISKWENGQTLPNATQFLALCRALGVRDVLHEFSGQNPFSPFTGLNREGIRLAEHYVSLLHASGLYEGTAESRPSLRTLPLYQISVSAGTGQFLDSSDYETVEVDDTVPISANFGVRIAGDSMEPLLQNGQIVWVHQQQTVSPGDIGIFLYEGSAYCKRLAHQGGTLLLQSENPAYAPILIAEDGDFRIFGKVV